jgi:superfamily II DNA or RNA helicase
VIAEIARLTTERGGRVMFLVHRKELKEQITTSFVANDVPLTLCTIETVGRLIHRLDDTPKPALIITDETHHGLAKTYQRIYDYYADVPRLGFTATPWRLSGKGLGAVYEDMIEGPTVSWLIQHKFLAPFDYYAPTLIDVERLKKSSTGDYSKQSTDEASKKIVFGDVISHYRRLADGRQAIVYAHSVEEAKRVCEQFNSAGIPSAEANGKTPTAEREQIMADFKNGKTQVLCNYDLVSEGFNVPECSCVIMLRPTASLVLYVQQSMRCMRYQPDKRAVIIDHVANAYRFGLPDAEREWTLEDRDKSKKSGKSTGPAITTCPQCFAVIPAGYSKCPICGGEIKAAQKEIEVDESAKLEKLKAFEIRADYENIDYMRMQPSEARDLTDLQGIAKARGYKNGWAFYQAKTRGMLRA